MIIAEYIRKQLKEDITSYQISLFEKMDSFREENKKEKVVMIT